MGSTWSTRLASIQQVAGAQAAERSRPTSRSNDRWRPLVGHHVDVVGYERGLAYGQELCRRADADPEAAVRSSRLVGIALGTQICETGKEVRSQGTQTSRPAGRGSQLDQRRSVCASPQTTADIVLDELVDGAGRTVRDAASAVGRLEDLSPVDARRLAVGA